MQYSSNSFPQMHHQPHLGLIKIVSFLSIIGFSLFFYSISIQPGTTTMADQKKFVYSVWGIPAEEVRPRLKKLMKQLGEEFNGPEFEPHVTVVGAISLTKEEATEKFRAACDGVKAYEGRVQKVETGTFFYQCVFLLLDPTPEVVDTSAHSSGHLGYRASTPYMPHLSLLYADISDEDKKKAQERARALDPTIESLKFPITHLALYKTDTEDKTLKSWEKITDCRLITP